MKPAIKPSRRHAAAMAAGVATITVVLALGWWHFAAPAHQVARGSAVYRQHCASCHGERLEGQPDWKSRRPDGRMPAPPHDASGHTWHHANDQLFVMVKHGIEALAPPGYRSDMPAYADVLSDDEIRAVIAFIESTWPEEIRRRRDRMPRQTR